MTRLAEIATMARAEIDGAMDKALALDAEAAAALERLEAEFGAALERIKAAIRERWPDTPALLIANALRTALSCRALDLAAAAQCETCSNVAEIALLPSGRRWCVECVQAGRQCL